MIGEIWIGNNDWPQNNIKIWRCAGTNFRWQFALLDLEWALRPHEWTTSSFDAIQYLNGRGTSYSYSGFWYKMMQNEEYKFRFINRFADLMNTNYLPSNLKAIEQEMWDEISPMMHMEYERWGGSDITGQMNTYTSNHTIFRSELGARPNYMKSHIRAHYNLTKSISISLDVNDAEAGKIKISTIRPDDYPWTGSYFSDVPITIQAIPNPGYKFSYWSGESPYISDRELDEFTATISESSITFKANFISGSTSYNGITISEIKYKGGTIFPTGDWFEIFNSTDQNLDLTAWYFTDSDPSHRFDFADNTSISANKRLVVVSDSMLFEYSYPNVHFTGDFNFGLNAYSDEINLYNGNDELVVSVNYSNHYPWPLKDNVEGRTLELLDPNNNLNDPENWFAGCVFGSPGSAYNPLCTFASETNEEIIAVSEDGTHFLNAYPNPAGELLTLEFYNDKPFDQFNIKVYNMQGSLIKYESTGSLPFGLHIVPLDLSDIHSNQMLFIVVSGGDFYETVKVIKQ